MWHKIVLIYHDQVMNRGDIPSLTLPEFFSNVYLINGINSSDKEVKRASNTKQECK